MTTRKSIASILAPAVLVASPLAMIGTPPAAAAPVAPVAASGLKLTAPAMFASTLGTWVPVRANIKNTTSKPIARVVLKITPKRGTQVSTKSVAAGKIAPGSVTVVVVRIRAGQGQSSATLKAVSPQATSDVVTVSVISGFGL